MNQVQDTIIDNVQQFIKSYFADSLTDKQIAELNEELEVKILHAFWTHGITSMSSPESPQIKS
ncbi:MAG: hypothetical protein ACO34C_09770, partial [Candidatus Kapaibacteriota bacterium]